ncbi:MAG TPA: NUDIX domain-containing protein [Thermoanaerobaculia bacterium]|jgi:predicted NUDIX family phosphoesterase|nr:NUDIX domain-containing protein [Thermoanaerobaculia bacterium]
MTEQVMVVERSELARYIERRTFDLIRDHLDDILDIISDKHFFIDRPTAEQSPQYKQIIPYVVIRHGESYFLLTRTSKQTEARLHHKLSLGIGGHINPDSPTVLGGLQKELEEEVGVDGDYEVSFVGILNDDTTDVGRVHLGAVYVLDAATPSVTIRETDKMSGSWIGRAELASIRERMETWSQIVYDGLIAGG